MGWGEEMCSATNAVHREILSAMCCLTYSDWSRFSNSSALVCMQNQNKVVHQSKGMCVHVAMTAGGGQKKPDRKIDKCVYSAR